MAKKSYRKNYSTKKRGGLFGSSAAAQPVNRTLNATRANGAGAVPPAQPQVDGANGAGEAPVVNRTLNATRANGAGAAPPAQLQVDGANGAEMERQESIRAAAVVNEAVSSSASELSTPSPSISPPPSTSPTSVLKGGYKSRRKSKRNKKCKSKRNKKCKSRRK
jgi:hypothetical protein